MRKLFFLFVISSICYGDDVKDIPNRPPDVVSQPAKLEDYYVWDGHDWIWKEDFNRKKKNKLRGIVTLGPCTVKYIPDKK